MEISGKRIRKLEKKILEIIFGKEICPNISITPDIQNLLTKIGFSQTLNIGESILPNIIGPITKFNSDGSFTLNRELDKETVIHTRYHTWKEYHGREEVEQSGFIDCPYYRYQRKLIPAPSIELSIVEIDGEKYVIGRPLLIGDKTVPLIIHQINLFLEIFQKCMVGEFSGDLIKNVQIKKLNWRILPPGHRSFEELENDVSQIISSLKSNRKKIAIYRIETINEYSPSCYAFGQGGFKGYIVFGFPEKNIFILESIYENNATYVFEKNWKELSKLSKFEIIEGKLQKYRLIHVREWSKEIEKILQ